MKVRVEGRLVFNNLRLDAALAGMGIAYLPEDQVSEAIAHGRLVRVLEDWRPRFPGHLCHPPRRHHSPDAARRPAQGDHAETGGMVQEKVVAIAKVSQALVGQWSAMLADAAEQAEHLRHLMSGGRQSSMRDISGLAERWMAPGAEAPASCRS